MATPMYCSLVAFKNNTDTKIKADEHLDYSKDAGCKFIWIKPVDRKTKSIRGFQRCEVFAETVNGRKVVEVKYTVDRHSNKPLSNGSLKFIEDKIGNLKAPMLDTKFNRNKLASSYFLENRLWDFIDNKDDESIRKEAIEKGYDKLAEQSATTDEVVSMQQEEMAKLKAELARIQAEKAEMAKQIEVISNADGKRYRDRAKEEIHAEFESEVTAIKAKIGRGWHLSAEYKDKFIPLINKRCEELARVNNNSGNDAS